MTNNNQETIAYQFIVDNMISVLVDMNEILAITETAKLEKTIEHLAETLPNMKNIPALSNLEKMQKTIQNMANNLSDKTQGTVNMDEQGIQQAAEKMVTKTKNMIEILNITNQEKLERIIEFVPSILPKMIQLFSEIHWEKFEPMDEDILIAHRILNSEGVEQIVKEGFSKEKLGNELSNPMKTVLLALMLLYSTMGLVNDTTMITAKEITHNQIDPVVESIRSVDQTYKDNKKEQSIKQLNDSLKEKIPVEIIHLFMIVSKQELNLHETISTDSKVVGTLDMLDIVQIYERKSEWMRVLCEHRKKERVLEGWVPAEDLEDIQ